MKLGTMLFKMTMISLVASGAAAQSMNLNDMESMTAKLLIQKRAEETNLRQLSFKLSQAQAEVEKSEELQQAAERNCQNDIKCKRMNNRLQLHLIAGAVDFLAASTVISQMSQAAKVRAYWYSQITQLAHSTTSHDTPAYRQRLERLQQNLRERPWTSFGPNYNSYAGKMVVVKWAGALAVGGHVLAEGINGAERAFAARDSQLLDEAMHILRSRVAEQKGKVTELLTQIEDSQNLLRGEIASLQALETIKAARKAR